MSQIISSLGSYTDATRQSITTTNIYNYLLILSGKFPFKKIFHYMLAQFLGAFLGAAFVFFVYHEALLKFELANADGERLVAQTAAIWATYPAAHLSICGGLFDQVGLEESLECTFLTGV